MVVKFKETMLPKVTERDGALIQSYSYQYQHLVINIHLPRTSLTRRGAGKHNFQFVCGDKNEESQECPGVRECVVTCYCPPTMGMEVGVVWSGAGAQPFLSLLPA